MKKNLKSLPEIKLTSIPKLMAFLTTISQKAP